jgi:hypothetical protein
LATKREYHRANAEEVSQRSREWRQANSERARQKAAEWTAANRDKKRAASARRRAALKQAIPVWADMREIQRFYTLADRLTATTGVKAHVDHVIPLQSPIVCGLHCAANLTITTELLNKRKGNHWWPDMPTHGEEAEA